ncbi:MAG: hypothetical protein AAFR42_08805, partial [Cyanobacteria bacterium J06628_6]
SELQGIIGCSASSPRDLTIAATSSSKVLLVATGLSHDNSGEHLPLADGQILGVTAADRNWIRFRFDVRSSDMDIVARLPNMQLKVSFYAWWMSAAPVGTDVFEVAMRGYTRA